MILCICLVVRRPFWTQINAYRHWTPTLEISTNTFPVWGSSIAMHTYIYIYILMHYDDEPQHWKCMSINFQFGVQRRDAFIPQTGDLSSPVGSRQAGVSLCLSVYLSLRFSKSIFGDHFCGQLNLNEPKLYIYLLLL